MAAEGKKQTKERAKEPKVDAKEATHEADAREFIQKADSQELLRIAQQTGLAAHPLVRNYDNPQAPDFHQKGDDLRRLMYLEQKKHADFRNRVAYLLTHK